jgi:hypothetical protein
VDTLVSARAIHYLHVSQALEEGAGDGELSRNSLLACGIDVPFAGFEVADDRSPIRKTFGVVELRPDYERPSAINVAE